MIWFELVELSWNLKKGNAIFNEINSRILKQFASFSPFTKIEFRCSKLIFWRCWRMSRNFEFRVLRRFDSSCVSIRVMEFSYFFYYSDWPTPSLTPISTWNRTAPLVSNKIKVSFTMRRCCFNIEYAAYRLRRQLQYTVQRSFCSHSNYISQQPTDQPPAQQKRLHNNTLLYFKLHRVHTNNIFSSLVDGRVKKRLKEKPTI